MSSKLLKGKPLADKINQDVADHIQKNNLQKTLSILLIGEKPESLTYIRLKREKCKEVGIETLLHTFTKNQSIQDILETIDKLNQQANIHGIIIQLPLPPSFNQKDEFTLLNRVSPEKDIDGFHTYNMGKLVANQPCFIPCTAEACFELINYYKISLLGKHVVIIGSSKVVGLPLSILLLHNGATVTLCNKDTNNIQMISNTADILISACGVPELIHKEWIQEGCILIDVGINHLSNSKKKTIVGDVDLNDVIHKVKYITPVPGGIGPITIAMLMKHVSGL